MLDYTKIHLNAFVADLHCDSIHQIKRGYDFFKRNENYHIDIERMKEGGVNLQIFALFLDPMITKENRFSFTDYLLKTLKDSFKQSDEIKFCTSFYETQHAIANNKLVALAAIENGAAIDNSLENLEYFVKNGVIYMTLTHSQSHEWCSSSSDRHATEYGLTNFGIDVIKKMNDLKMIIDVSHISERAFNEVIAQTNAPIIASHSNAYALCGHDRNLNDEQLKAIADNGGVVGMNFCPIFLSEDLQRETAIFLNEHMEEYKKSMDPFSSETVEANYQKAMQEFKPFFEKYEKQMRVYEVSVSTVCDHIDHIVNLIGADHVSLGSDFDGIMSTPKGLEDISKMPMITKELVERNYTVENIEKILGKNFMRLFKEVTS